MAHDLFNYQIGDKDTFGQSAQTDEARSEAAKQVTKVEVGDVQGEIVGTRIGGDFAGKVEADVKAQVVWGSVTGVAVDSLD